MSYHENRYIEYLGEQAGQIGGDSWSDDYNPHSSLIKQLKFKGEESKKMKTFFSIEDIETVFKDAYDRGFIDSHKVLDTPNKSENSWLEYKASNQVTFQVNPSRPITDKFVDKDLLCPLCDGPMMARTNRQSGSKFWGCKKFPVCRGTRDTDDLSKEEKEAEKNREREPIQQQEGYPFRKGQ